MNSFIKKGIIFILMFLVVGEFSIRARDYLKGYGFFSNEFRDKLMFSESTIVPFRMFGPRYYTEKNGEKYIVSSHDELYPLKKPKNTFRIVCFGSSTTRNEFVFRKYKIHYPLLLQNFLQDSIKNKNIEVINVAFDAYATPHFLILLELDVVSWSPDLIIISENNNDLDAAYWKDFQFDYSNKYGTKWFLPQFLENYTTINALFHWSSLYWYIKDKIRDYERNLNRNNLARRRRAHFGNMPPEIIQYTFRRNLLDFYSIAHRWGISVLYASQPINANIESADFLPYDEDAPRDVQPLLPEYKHQFKFFNNILKQVADSTNSYFVDNDSSFAEDSIYFHDAIHYTKLGVEKLAHNYADYIISKKIIK